MTPTIWYVHGSGASPLSFTWLSRQLPFEARYFSYSIDEPAEDCVNRLHRLIREEPEPVVVVGHSLGGIIAASLAGRVCNVSKLVTLCAPFGGLPHAGFASLFNNSPVFRDLRCYSPVLMDIRDHHFSIPHLAIVADHGLPHISESNDGVVTLNSQTALAQTRYHKFDLNHFEVLLSPRVAEIIGAFLCDE